MSPISPLVIDIEIFRLLCQQIKMKKSMKISILFAFILVLLGIFIFRQVPMRRTWKHKTLPNFGETVNTVNKEAIQQNLQKLDDPEIPSHLSEKVKGNSEILAERLSKALAGMENLLLEIKLAFDEGRAMIKPDNYGTRYARIKTAGGEISLWMIRDDGRFSQCERTFYANGNGQKKEKLVFQNDCITPRFYKGPAGVLLFEEDGTLGGFDTDIEGKSHTIGWGDGKIDSYVISAVQG